MPSRVDRILSAVGLQRRALTANQAITGLWANPVTATGLRIDERSAMAVISVFTAVKILAEGFAQVPLKVYRAMPDGSRQEASLHPMYSLLHHSANERWTAFAMREFIVTCLALWGNAYIEIVRNMRGEVVELWPLPPGGTTPHRLDGGRVEYHTYINSDASGYAASSTQIVLPESQVLHIRGQSLDGFKGLSVIGQIRENVGLAAGYTEFAARYFGNGAQPGFALVTDKTMQKDQVDLMHKEWADQYQGLRNSQKVAILHGGLKPQALGVPPEDAQFLESRQYEREEIFSYYRIPPNFYSANRITSWGSGIKEMSVGFVKFTLDPWFVRVEQALNQKFFAENAQGPLFPEFDREGFLRGDFAARIDGYEKLFNMGVVSNVWIAKTENLPAPPKEVFLVQGTLVPIDQIAQLTETKINPPKPQPPASGPAAPQSDGSAARAALLRSQRHVLADAFDRILRRERADVVRAVEKIPANDLDKWLESFYADHQTFAAKQLSAPLRTFAEAVRADVARETGKDIPAFDQFVRSYGEGLGLRIASAGHEELQRAIKSGKEFPWNRTAEQMAAREVIRAGNAFAVTAYRAVRAGARWITGDSCDECSTLDGTTFSADQKHPPLCDDCSCIIVARRQGDVLVDEPNVVVNVTTPSINVTTPPVNVAIQPAPAPQVDVHVAAQPAPIVTVNVPEQAALPIPVINVTTPQPIVNVKVEPTPIEVKVAPAAVEVKNIVPVPSVAVQNTVEAPSGELEAEFTPTGALKKLKRKK